MGLAAIVAMGMLVLTGCFVLPLADGRSPFDAGGPSFDQVEAQEGPIQAVVDEALQGTGWAATVSTAQDNCEGPCNLRLGIDITPEAATIEAAERSGAQVNRGTENPIPLPPATLKALIEKVVPVAAAAKLDVSLISDCADEAVLEQADTFVDACTGLFESAQAVLGTTDDYFSDSMFQLRGSGSYTDDELIVESGSHSADSILARLQDVPSGDGLGQGSGGSGESGGLIPGKVKG